MFAERKIESILKTIAGTFEYGLGDAEYYLNDGTKTNVPQEKEVNENGTSGGQTAGQIPNEEPKRQVLVQVPYTCDTDHLNSQFRIGSRVEVQHDGTRRGVIRWIGYVRDPQQLLAGIELVHIFNDRMF